MEDDLTPGCRHFLHRMRGVDQAPFGDTASWFRFYKWDVEGEVFVTRPNGRHLAISQGDLLWFALDAELVGGALITRTLIDPLGSYCQELWYEPTRGWAPRSKLLLSNTLLSCEEVSPWQSGTWLAQCVSRLEGAA